MHPSYFTRMNRKDTPKNLNRRSERIPDLEDVIGVCRSLHNGQAIRDSLAVKYPHNHFRIWHAGSYAILLCVEGSNREYRAAVRAMRVELGD